MSTFYCVTHKKVESSLAARNPKMTKYMARPFVSECFIFIYKKMRWEQNHAEIFIQVSTKS